MNGRMYDPLLGRFASVDPEIQYPDDPQSFNGYGYCMNNPLKYSDPSGMLFAPPGVGDAVNEYFGWMTDVTAFSNVSFGGGGGGGMYSSGGGGANENWVGEYLYESNVMFYGSYDYARTGAYISKYDGHIESYAEYYANKIAPDLATFAQVYHDFTVAKESLIALLDEANKYATLTASVGNFGIMPNTTPWMDVAATQLGITEIYGVVNNLSIMDYLSTTGGAPNDETAWCSSFVNWVLKQVGIQGTNSSDANSWLNWKGGTKIDDFRYGSIVVIDKGRKAHVGFGVYATDSYVNVLGGNQGTLGKVKYSNFYFNTYDVTYIYPIYKWWMKR